MQTTLTYRTNRDLFSNHYLDEHLPETEAWNEVDDETLREAYDEIADLWERERDTAPKRNESQLEEKFIRPMFRKLGIPFEVEESTSRTQRRPDYGFFETEDAARDAFERREAGGDFYENAVAVADAKRWGRPLDTRGSGEHDRDFENPSYQIHVYLQEVDAAQWAVLTNGRKWRLYYGPTSHRLDSYYEVDLPTILEDGDLADFKYFYLFFLREAFLEDAGGDSFLDDVYGESNVFAQELGEDLQDNIYEAIKVLSEGYLQYPGNDLDGTDLDLVHDASLIYLYRLIFVLYAEAEGRQLLDTDNEIYEESYSLNALKQEVAEELDSADPTYRDWQDDLSDRLDELFSLIDQGSRSQGIPEEDLYVPAYNGGLFRTDPDDDDSDEARFLANHTVGDAHLARVVELLTRSRSDDGTIFVDYSSLDVRHLGSIYEGLLEYRLHVADGPLRVEDGEYVPAAEGGDFEGDEGDFEGDEGDVAVEEGEVYLTTGSGERKATGSYYTPEYVVEYIVDETLGPLVDDVREDLVGQSTYKKDDGEAGTFAGEFAERIFELKVLDPAMGSGHFLTSAVDYLAREIIDAQERQAEQREEGEESRIDMDRDINWARRKVAQRCIYGVDLNPLATELAKVSLWLRTLAAEQPLAFLDHHLKTGNSLVGSDIEDVLANGEGGGDDAESGQLTLQQSFDRTRQQAIEHVMDRFQNLLSIDNETLADAKRMEDVYDEVRDDDLYKNLLAMANVHTAEAFGLDVPSDADERMARALKSESWKKIEGQDWFEDAQAMAAEEHFFHWELEFPVAFYDVDGGRKADAGFDAVIGNPPYIRMEQIKPLKPYLASNYDVHDTRVDLYGYFIEKSLDLTLERYGVVVSNKWIKSKYGEKIRSVLDKHQIEEIIDFGDLEVFEGATAYPCILTVNTNRSLKNGVSVTKVENLEFSSLPDVVSKNSATIPPDLFDDGDWTVTNPKVAKINDKLEEKHGYVSEYIHKTCETDIGDGIGRGVVTGLNEAFLVDQETKDELIKEDGSSEDIIYSCIKGTDISRYQHDRERQYLIYCHSGIEIDEYPAVKLYLKQYKSQLEGTATDEEWYELQQPQEEYIEEFTQKKIIYPDIAKHSRFSMDTSGDYLANTVFMIPSEDYYLLSILNSKIFETLFRIHSPSIRGGYHRYINEYVKNVPIPLLNIDKKYEETNYKKEVETLIEQYDKYIQKGSMPKTASYSNTVIREFLSHLSKSMLDDKKRRNEFNLDLPDYLGNYTEGPSLPDIGLFQPTGENVLDATTEDYEKLQIERARVERSDTTVTIEATARYKPEDEEAHETDTYGYTETGFFEAFSLTDLSETEAALVAAFVPVAVDDEIAGFRDNATKTNSLVDRLKGITLPDPDDVAADLDRYVETRDRADELDDRIARTDRLIDEIVYELYGLTDEEIEIVENAVEA
ncbi:type II restriction/modification system DNA methylase subunit YeeA [Halorubrum alkaliphilum]|uniref:site-specific DNA-methyltransferase (adenine-specific) n=1 Tax=Halorubrum alkaliphilum TaxID=261290 RepID=A0A8T4GGS7_9EURY|nr:TaqI-like C-terminal specificity domain-containing protein [Halorubrum alkaliphilum]MBP1922929.1 type II restriction/modification system DNA methylase subunit YeeA [Halorubrum alkaliphilum]